MKNRFISRYYIRILCICLAFLLFLTTCLCIVYSVFSNQTFYDFATSSSETLAQEMEYKTQSYFSDLDELLNGIYKDSDYLGKLNSDTFTDELSSRRLVAGSSYFMSLRGIYIYNNSNIMRSGCSRMRTGTQTNFDIMNRGEPETIGYIWDYLNSSNKQMAVFFVDDSSGTYIRTVKKLYQQMGQSVIGYIICDLKTDGLKRIIRNINTVEYIHVWLRSADHGSCMLTDKNYQPAVEYMENEDKASGNITIDSADNAGGKAADKTGDNAAAGTVTIIDKKAVYTQTAPSSCGISCCIYTDETWINSNLKAIRRLFTCSVVLELWAAGIFYVVLSRKIRKRINDITDSLEIISSGQYDIRLSDKGKDEIGIICSSFNDLMDNLAARTKAETMAREALAYARYDALQAQVNPHFLFNTLETMGSIAMYQDCGIVNDMCEALAKMMRYSIQGETVPRESTLRQELDYLNNYMVIINVRTRNLLNLSIYLGDELMKVKMPRLTIQPIVENAIRHGLKNKHGEKIINIHAKIQGKDVFVMIDDNGDNDDTELINDIINKKLTKTSSHTSIGITNINDRITFLYGPQYGVSAEKIDGFTRMTIHLPATEGGSYE